MPARFIGIIPNQMDLPIARATSTRDLPNQPIREILDGVMEALRTETTPAVHLESLVQQLSLIRSLSSALEWRKAIAICRSHKILADLLEDPFTKRSFEKPRGYPGDAVMMDMIYNSSHGTKGTSKMGCNVFGYTGVSGRSPRAVRARRHLLATMIADRVIGHEATDVLSIACGHLREASIVTPATLQHATRWVAMDHDPKTIATCKRDAHHPVIRPMLGSVKTLLARGADMGSFDFVYSAGLFDYLSDRMAAALCNRMMSLCRPGGMILIANFAEELPDAGYMEAFMDWRLIYRSQQALIEIFERSKGEGIFLPKIFSDSTSTVHYLTAARVG